ncbi:MAG: GNAT family N-acetyltransferase, partial [Clostridia bacterium]|nr:GNAT family N-acetyltransferase [Clostridia bacterium]
MEKMNYFPALYELLAKEYNCVPGDFLKKENILTESRLIAGRRVYSRERYFFHMVTTGGNAVVTADECLHPFLQDFIRDRMGHWLFEFPNLLPLEAELNRYGYTMPQSYHMFLPVYRVEPQRNDPVKWYFEEEIHQFYGQECYRNAISREYNPDRPDRMAVCAYDGDTIMGMAGCTEDGPGWMQIGIDVMEPYRSRGIGTYLVTQMTYRILNEGKIPFYGSSLTNYH